MFIPVWALVILAIPMFAFFISLELPKEERGQSWLYAIVSLLALGLLYGLLWAIETVGKGLENLTF